MIRFMYKTYKKIGGNKMTQSRTLNLAIIGTSWITKQFVDAALGTDKYHLDTIYSRTLEKAKSFGESYQVEYYTDNLSDLANREGVDVVYIASPNSLHFEQAMTMIDSNKHVVVEKPIFSTSSEWNEAIDFARKRGVYVFEAARHIHDPNFIKVKDEIQTIDNIQGASLTFMKYSSRYDQVLNGEEPPVFSQKFSGGALMDLGVYLLYAAISFFGEPESSRYNAHMIRTGVDGKGIGVLHYPDFDVTIHCGKNALSLHSNEIYGLDKTFEINSISTPTNTRTINSRTMAVEKVDILTANENPLSDEAEAFAEVLLNPDNEENQSKYRNWLELSQQVNKIMTIMRYDAGIYFPADEK